MIYKVCFWAGIFLFFVAVLPMVYLFVADKMWGNSQLFIYSFNAAFFFILGFIAAKLNDRNLHSKDKNGSVIY